MGISVNKAGFETKNVHDESENLTSNSHVPLDSLEKIGGSVVDGVVGMSNLSGLSCFFHQVCKTSEFPPPNKVNIFFFGEYYGAIASTLHSAVMRL